MKDAVAACKVREGEKVVITWKFLHFQLRDEVPREKNNDVKPNLIEGFIIDQTSQKGELGAKRNLFFSIRLHVEEEARTDKREERMKGKGRWIREGEGAEKR